MCAWLATITRSPSKHCSRMNRARENVRPQGDHDHCPPAVMRRQTTQLPPFPFRGWRIVSRVASKLSWRSPARDLLCGKLMFCQVGSAETLSPKDQSINT